MARTPNQSPLDLPCTNGRSRTRTDDGFPCHRRAVKFYRNPSTGFMFATCQKCLRRATVKGEFVRITREEYQVCQVLES